MGDGLAFISTVSVCSTNNTERPSAGQTRLKQTTKVQQVKNEVIFQCTDATCFDCFKGLRYPGLPSSDTPGKIYTLDLKDPLLKPLELRMPRNFDLDSFNPHGISLFVDPSGKFVCVSGG